MQSPLIFFLIDNDEEDQEIFNLALNEIDPAINCLFGDNCHSAINKLDADTSLIPFMIFIDMNMPLVNGTGCLQKIKSIPRLKKVPVYMYSTAGDPRAMKEAKELGADDFIVKPSSFQGLVNLLSQLLQNHANK
jgi:Response regulator containing a CheY-like receiver domain and a GGDEF domain